MNDGDMSKPAYAFDQSKHQGGRRQNFNSYQKAIEWCRELKPIFDNAQFNVYNVNPTSALDVFPYVSFDQAFANCRGSFVSGNADLKDWYLKFGKDGSTEDG